jgi:hypothetical protein
MLKSLNPQSCRSCFRNFDCEEAVVEQTATKHQKTSESQETDEDDTTECEQVTNHAARKFIAGLRLYFIQEDNEGSPTSD